MMGRLLKLTVSLVILIVLVESKSLPKYLKKCSLKVPDQFTKCALEVANKSMKEFIHGDKEHKVLDFDPFEIPEIALNTPGLNLTLRKAVITGTQNVEVNSLRYDKKSRKFYMDTFLDNLVIEGNYEVGGKIIVLPISGQGHCKLEFLNGTYNYVFDFNPVMKNGKEVIKVQNPELRAKFERVKFNLDNLFDGNEQLAKEMKNFLNENWEEVMKEFDSLLVDPVKAVVYSLFTNFLDDLTYDEVFSDL